MSARVLGWRGIAISGVHEESGSTLLVRIAVTGRQNVETGVEAEEEVVQQDLDLGDAAVGVGEDGEDAGDDRNGASRPLRWGPRAPETAVSTSTSPSAARARAGRSHQGGALQTILVDDLDGLVAEIGSRGIEPDERVTHSNGVSKRGSSAEPRLPQIRAIYPLLQVR